MNKPKELFDVIKEFLQELQQVILTQQTQIKDLQERVEQLEFLKD